MIELCPGGGGTADKVGAIAALFIGPNGSFLTDSNFLMVVDLLRPFWYGELAPRRAEIAQQRSIQTFDAPLL